MEFHEFNLYETIINKRNNGRIKSTSLNFYESFKILTIIASRKSIIHCKYHNFFRPRFGNCDCVKFVFMNLYCLNIDVICLKHI
jgi:hypothetical protein